MRSSSKSGLDGVRKRSIACFTQLLRRISPASKEVVEGKSPYMSFSLTNPKVESKWQRCKEKLEGKKEEKGQIARIPRKKSCTDIYTEPSQRSASPKLSFNPSDHPAFSLNQTLTTRLRSLGPHYDIKARFLIFQDIFSTVIGLDSLWALLLRRIKNGYEEVVSQCLKCDYEREVEKMSKQVTEVNDYLEALVKDKETLCDNLDALTKENEELRTTIKQQSEAMVIMGKQLETTGDDPQSIVELQDELVALKCREQSFVTALKSARQQNFTIEDLLRTLSRHKKTKSTDGGYTRPLIIPSLSIPGRENGEEGEIEVEKAGRTGKVGL